MAYTVEKTDEFDQWLDGLTDTVAQKAIAKRLVRVQAGLFGDRESVGGGVTELKFHIGPGYRVYYTIRERVVVFVLWGGAKSTQTQDIAKAQDIASRL